MSVWIQEGRSDNGHDLFINYTKTTPRECHEQNVDLYTTFVDFNEAFNTVSRDGFWKIMAISLFRHVRLIAIVRQLNDDMLARVQNDREYSEPFAVTNGVKQGYVLAPTLFSLMFSAMLTYEPRHEKTCLCHMRTTKAQISLCIRAVWSAPLLFAAYVV